jgi:hypothetical protein
MMGETPPGGCLRGYLGLYKKSTATTREIVDKEESESET